jgi:hypothetical protein
MTLGRNLRRCPVQERDAPDFDWSTDDSVVLQQQLTTAIYFNNADELVIRQELTNVLHQSASSDVQGAGPIRRAETQGG